MSKVEKAPKTVTLKKSYRQFDPISLEEKTIPVEVPFTPAADYESAVNRLGENATEKLLKAVNAFLKRDALTAERQRIGGEGIPSSVVMTFIKTFRVMPQFASLEKDRKAQTAAILDAIRGNEFTKQALIALGEQARKEDAEDDQDDKDDAD